MNWKILPKEQLEAEYKAEVDAGKTKLTYNEWAARRIVSEAQGKKTKAVDKAPVDNNDNTQSVEKNIPRAKPAKKPKASGGKAKEKPAPSPADDPQKPLINDKGVSTLPGPKPLPQPEVDDRTKLESGLTAKQELFCREYVIDYNGTQAAIRTGYSAKTARSQAQRLLTKDDIQRFIAELQKPKLQALDISADWIIQEYAKMARANLGRFLRRNEDGTIHTVDGLPSYDFSDVTDDDLVGLGGLEVIILPAMGEDEPNPLKVKVKMGDKKAALDVLAKRAGLLKEHIEHSGEVKIKGDPQDLAMRVAFMLRQAAARDKKES